MHVMRMTSTACCVAWPSWALRVAAQPLAHTSDTVWFAARGALLLLSSGLLCAAAFRVVALRKGSQIVAVATLRCAACVHPACEDDDTCQWQ